MNLNKIIGLSIGSILLLIGCSPPESNQDHPTEAELDTISEMGYELDSIPPFNPKDWIRLRVSEGIGGHCKDCEKLNIPYYSVIASFDDRPGPIFFNRYDFQNQYFSWGIYPTGDEFLIIEGRKIYSGDLMHNTIIGGKSHIEWTDSSLFFSFIGKRRNFMSHDEAIPQRKYMAIHYILREGDNLTHAIYEDTVPPFKSLDREKVLSEGAIMKITTTGKEKGLTFHYKGDSARWETIELYIEEEAK